MALDQEAADAYAAQLISAPSIGEDDGPTEKAQARAAADRYTQAFRPQAQALVDALARTEPMTERVFDLRASLGSTQGATSWLLLCTDRRVVWGLTHSAGPQVHAFGYGEVQVDRRMMKLLPELLVGTAPKLVVPRMTIDDKELERMLEADGPPSTPAAHYTKLVGAVAKGRRPAPYQLEVPSSAGTAPIAGPPPATPPPAVSPASWQPDPTGRHDHRWWDGSRWTEHVADDGIAAIDPS